MVHEMAYKANYLCAEGKSMYACVTVNVASAHHRIKLKGACQVVFSLANFKTW